MTTHRLDPVPSSRRRSRGSVRARLGARRLAAHAVRASTARSGSATAHGSRRRAWRRRGRRGQVAAVATILGLLLFVTMLANYLATQLPAQMRLNDANHALAVENQLARFGATLEAVALADVIGGVVSQPISLGSLGAPPFASADGASVGPGDTGTGFTEAYTVTSAKNVSIPQSTTNLVPATFVVHLRNTYSPPADIAFDQGAVVYGQANGLPLMLVGPAVNYTGGTLTLWIPQFVGQLGSEVGTGTADISARLTSVASLTLPGNGFSLATGKSVVITITTPYAAAWMDYFDTQPTLAGLASCAPATSSVCIGPFSFGGALATVTLTVPATGLVLNVATYSLALT